MQKKVTKKHIRIQKKKVTNIKKATKTDKETIKKRQEMRNKAAKGVLKNQKLSEQKID